MRKKLKNIQFKFNEISLRNSLNQSEKIKSIVEQINNSISKLYLPSKELTILEKILYFDSNKSIKLLYLIDINTNFIIKLSVASYQSHNINNDIINLLDEFYTKDHILYLKETLTNVDLMKMLRKKGFRSYGITKSQFFKENTANSPEILKNNEGLYLCMFNDMSVLTNLSEIQLKNEMMTEMKNEGIFQENDIFRFFEKKLITMKSIKTKQSNKFFQLNKLYDKFLLIIFDIALHNAYIMASDDHFDQKELDHEDFLMNVIENLLGFDEI